MRIIKPQRIDENTLIETSVPLSEYPVWQSGIYEVGSRVTQGVEVYESVKDENTDTIEQGLRADPATWLRVGFANRWRMFRDGRDSKTIDNGAIEFDIRPGVVTSGLALLAIEGLSFSVTVVSESDGVLFENSYEIQDIGVANIWEFFFKPYEAQEDFVLLDLPPYQDATYKIKINAVNEESPVSLGRFVLGMVNNAGTTDHDTSVRWLNFSDFNRNLFGDLEIVARRAVRITNYPVTVDRSRTNTLIKLFDDIINEPSVFVGEESEEGTITFGIPRRPQVTYSNPAVSDLSLEVEEF